MNDHSASHLPFDVWDPDGLLFDDEPNLFVNLDTHPIVFSVRGIAYFKPRFAHVGVAISSLTSAEDFRSAYGLWMDCELALLDVHLQARSDSERGPGVHSELYALWRGDLEGAAHIAERRARLELSSLQLVSGGSGA